MKAGLGTLKGEEFKELAKNIDIAEKELLSLEKAQQSSRKEFGNLRKATGDLSKEQLKNAGELKDKIGDQQQQIRILSSDTKKLDFGIEAVSLAAHGYQALTGAMQLFGVENEDALKSIQKLQAIMAITNALREIQNSLLAEGTLRTLANDFATKGAATAQLLYATAVGTSTGAMKLFKIALLGTGIGALIVLIGTLTYYFVNLKTEADKASESINVQKEILDKSASSIAEATTNITSMGLAFDNAKKGVIKKSEALEIYNETFGKTIGYANTYNEAEELFFKNSTKYITAVTARAKVDATRGVLTAELEKQVKLGAEYDRLQILQSKGVIKETKTFTTVAYQMKGLVDDFNDSRNRSNLIVKQLTTNTLAQAKAEQELAKTGGDTQKEHDRKIEAEKEKSKKVESDRKKQISKDKKADDDRLKALQEAKEKELKLQQDHDNLLNELLNTSNDEIFQNNVKASKSRLDLITDDYAQQRATIEQEFDTQSQILLEKTTELQSKLRLQLTDSRTSKNDKAEIKSTIDNIQLSYEGLLTTLRNEKDIKIANFEFEHFNKTLKELRDNAENLGIQLETSHLGEILKLNQTYNNGAISYEDYQKNLTKLNETYNKKRLQNSKETILKELSEINNKLLGGGLTPEQFNNLNNQKTKLKNDLAKLENDLTTPKDGKGETQNDKLKPYAEFYNALLSTALSTYSAIVEAEQKALDRSIAIQEKRVSRALKLAERGNTEYLELEEQRLVELELKREQSARRQIQISQALQASNILLAVTGAVAKIGQGGSTAEILGAIATIISSLGAGAVLVAQNQSQQPSFYVGSDKIDGSKTTAKNINVHGSEAVIQDHDGTATKYRPTIKALRRNLLPVEFMNMISTNALNGKQLNYEAINGATNVYNEKKNYNFNPHTLEKKLDLLASAIEGIKMNVSYDKKGLSSSLEIEIDRIKRVRNA